MNAILQVWYPGARGGKAAADILFGSCSPSGKLPVTFYRDLDGFPAFEDYSMKGRTYRYLEKEPLYPFGYGLTYGRVEVREAVLAEVPALSALEKAGQGISKTDVPDKGGNFAVKRCWKTPVHTIRTRCFRPISMRRIPRLPRCILPSAPLPE